MKRDQTVYTCDGCRTTQAYDYASMPPGWYDVGTAKISETSLATQYHLCLRCFSGVDWILRFQGVTVPPEVVSDPKPLRRHSNAPCDVEPILSAAEPCPQLDEHEFMSHCGLCGWERERPLHITVDLHDGPRGAQQPGATHVHNHGPDEGPGTRCREHRNEGGRLVGECITPEAAETTAAEEPFSLERWAESLLAARFPDMQLQLARSPFLDVDVQHRSDAVEYDLTLRATGVRLLSPQRDGAAESEAGA